MTAIYEMQQSLSILAGTTSPPWLEAQQAANIWAGTVGLDLQAALNYKYLGVPGGTHDIQDAANLLAGTTGKETQDALSNLAGGGHT